ncbi:MAG: DUF1848 domain-containing protein [Deltaproteobacteria bacterium]|nr:DUF1848 domain-containing protein [Deltaproteobacteria bacterium]
MGLPLCHLGCGPTPAAATLIDGAPAQLEEAGWGFEQNPLARDKVWEMLAGRVRQARGAGMALTACAPEHDLSPAGLRPGACISPAWLAAAWGLSFPPRRDPGQRSQCRCLPSRDLGSPDTCLHHCVYCYATRSEAAARANQARPDPRSPRLVGPAGEDDSPTLF